MKLRVPLFQSEIPVARYEIPATSVAAGQTNAKLFTIPVPQDAALIRVVLKAIDATAGDQAVYELTQAARNVPSKLVLASGTLTFSGQPLNAETVVIAGKTYTFQTTLTNSDGNVLIGATTADSIANLAAALKLASGAGTTYAAATTAHSTVDWYSNNATTLVVKAKSTVNQVLANAYGTTETLTNGSWGGATLSGGVDAIILLGSAVASAMETDSSWDANLYSDAPNGIQVRVTSDATNATVFSGAVEVEAL